MLKFELSISEKKFNELQSKDLKKSLTKMVQAVAGVNKNQWQYAINLHNIVVNEYYKPDYKNVPDLAEDLKLDKGTVSKMVSAVKMMVNVITPKYGYSFEQIPYTKAASLASIKDLDNFIKVMNVDILTISMRELEQAKRDYKAMQDNAVDVNAKTDETETADTMQEVKEEKQDETFTGYIENDTIVITLHNVTYRIPVDELKHYRV